MICNPVSGNRKKLYLEKHLKNHLDKNQFAYKIVYTNYAGHGYEIALNAARENYHLVIVAGGDGMINETAHGLINSETAMGIIPCGSGNGLARHLKIPLSPIKAIKTLNCFNTIFIDTFTINHKHIFCNMAGVGFDALVAKKFVNSKKRGFITYLKTILKEFVKYKPQKYKLELDSENHDITAFMINFANSGQFGNNAIIAPMASVTDGILNVCVMKIFKWYQAPYIGLMLLIGRIDKTPFINYYNASGVKLDMFNNNHLHLDGDPYELGNEIYIKPNRSSLKVVIP